MNLSEILDQNIVPGKRSVIICANEGDIDTLLTSIQDKISKRGKNVGICRADRSLFENMSAFENIVLTKNHPRGKKRKQQYTLLMDLQTQIGSNINLDLPVNRLDVVEKYTVELMRLAVLAPEVIVIDYILSFLGYYEYNTFCNLLSVMKEKGCTVIILTNRWEDMLGICSEFILYNRIHDSYTVIATEEVQKNPQKLFLELMGYENQESSATLVSTLNAISGIVELFDTGKNLETEITKLTDIAKSNLKASSCIVYLQGFDNKIISYYKRLLA